jgi:hypothetical protein
LGFHLEGKGLYIGQRLRAVRIFSDEEVTVRYRR